MGKCVLEVSDAALVRLSDPAAALAAGSLWSARCAGDVGEIQRRYRGDMGEIQARSGRRGAAHISPTSPLYLPYISPVSPLHLRHISPASPRCVASVLTQQRCADACLRQPKPPFLRSLLGALAAYHPSPLLTTPLRCLPPLSQAPPSCAACSVRGRARTSPLHLHHISTTSPPNLHHIFTTSPRCAAELAHPLRKRCRGRG